MSADSRRTTGIVIAFASLAIAVAGLAICIPRADQQPESVSQNSARTRTASPSITGLAAVETAGRSRLTAEQADAVREFLIKDLPEFAAGIAYCGLHMSPPMNPTSLVEWVRFQMTFEGCWIVPYWFFGPDTKPRQLIFHSEDLRNVPEIWEQAWEMELPDVVTPSIDAEGRMVLLGKNGKVLLRGRKKRVRK